MNTTYYRNKELTEVIQGLGRGTIGWKADESGAPCEFLFTGTEWILMYEYRRQKAEKKKANIAKLQANPGLAREFAQQKHRDRRSRYSISWHRSDSCYYGA